jgi:hypothetical protein
MEHGGHGSTSSPTGNLRSIGPSEQRDVVGPDGTVHRRRSFLIYTNRQQV